MMLALGMFVFMRQTLPHQTMQRESDYRWPSNSRIGKRDAYQFLGVGEENITLAGVLYPELTGGKLTMTTLRLMAEEGRAWPLLDGTGMIYGMYVISRVSETGVFSLQTAHPEKLILRCRSPALMNHWPRFMAISVNRRNRSSVRLAVWRLNSRV